MCSRKQWSCSTSPTTGKSHLASTSKIQRKSCPICFQYIRTRSVALISPCMHAFCIHCIYKWSHIKATCPLCNSYFDSCLQFSVSDRIFVNHRLPHRHNHRLGNSTTLTQRVIERSRKERGSNDQRSRPMPSRRAFTCPGSASSSVAAESALQWRASIYTQRLQAVPFSSRKSLNQSISGNNSAKERIIERIEPWIRRELEAILGDPDPSVIVHVVTSVFLSALEGRRKVPTGDGGNEDKFLAPLRPFLCERIHMFWHELRCFAESSYTMETYDSVVECKAMD